MPTRKDSRGFWHVEVCVNRKRLHRRCPKGASASDAKRLEADLMRSLHRRSPNVPGDPMLPDLLADYTERHAEHLRSPDTARFHAYRIGRWLEGKRASEAKGVAAKIAQDLQGHYAPATINRSLGSLKKALRTAWEQERTEVDYSAYIKRLPEHNQRDVTLSLEQVMKLASHASENVAAAIWIALYTGCRRGELLKIAAADISDEEITVRAGNTKTLKTRTIPIVAPLRPWLMFLPLAINAEGLKSGFQRARKSAGMPHVTFHDLRRSCATLMIQSGIDLYVVSKLLGHSTIAVTQERYAHLQTDRMRDGLRRTFE